MAKDFDILKQQAEAIKTEVNKNANTSERVGGMLGDMLDYTHEEDERINQSWRQETGHSDYPTFSESKDYNIGDIVNYNGSLKKFIVAHPAGVWIGTDVEATNLDKIKAEKLTELEKEIGSGSDSWISTSSSSAYHNNTVFLPFKIIKGGLYTITFESENADYVGEVYARIYSEGGKAIGNLNNSNPTLSYIASEDYEKGFSIFVRNYSSENGEFTCSAKYDGIKRFEDLNIKIEENTDVIKKEIGIPYTKETKSTSGKVIEFIKDIYKNSLLSFSIEVTADLEKSIGVFGIKNDDTFDVLHSFYNNAKIEVLAENDYKLIRFYDNNVSPKGFTASLEVKSIIKGLIFKNENEFKVELSKLNSYYESTYPIKKELTWKNVGGYWHTSGKFIENSSYDISNPIDVSDFKYYGFYGKLHKDNYTIVSVNINGDYTGYIIQKGVLSYDNTGNSLFIFKIPDGVNYISVSTHNNDKNIVDLFELKSPYLINFIDNQIDIKSEVLGENENKGYSTSNASRTLTIPYKIKKGSKYRVNLLQCDSDKYQIDVYTESYPTPPYGNLKKSSPILEFQALSDFDKVQCYINVKDDTEDEKEVIISVKELSLSEKLLSKNSINDIPPLRVLVLGDSYSQGGGQWIKPMISYFPQGSTWISLAVSSATIRDRYTDRNTYPYTDRPVSTDNTGNHNTLACQIQKLKRLMAGVDLDEGESKIYSTESSYPNVIIIEGGMNDGADTEDKEKTYFNQFEKYVNNVYIKQKSSMEVSQGQCYIQTPIEEVDRTCFAGAYRYLVEELLSLFPNAQIFFTTASGLGYWSGSVVKKRYDTAKQQRQCANLCAATVIDWSAEGQINSIVNHPSGSGTEDDPYIWGETKNTGYNDTNDAMHPNQRGGNKYGKLAALVIMQRFLNISDL